MEMSHSEANRFEKQWTSERRVDSGQDVVLLSEVGKTLAGRVLLADTLRRCLAVQQL